MQFTVGLPSAPLALPPPPSAALRSDRWDDFGYQTMYDLVVFPGELAEPVSIGKVKILELGQRSGSPDIPSRFETLGTEFIALGQNYDFYEALKRLGRRIYDPVLRALNDIVYDPTLLEPFVDEPGYRSSLFRFSEAESAFETARRLFNQPVEDPLQVMFSVRTSVGGDPFEIEFDWDTSSVLPGHLAAVIGYNGSGKTQLLANLAFIAAKTGVNLDDEERHKHGQVLHNSLGTFAGVLAVSYSAFDTFALPYATSAARDAAGVTESDFGYTYIGLRKPAKTPDPESLEDLPHPHSADPGHTSFGPSLSRLEHEVEYELKAPAELVIDFENALQRLRTKERIGALDETLSFLLQEPSFASNGLRLDVFRQIPEAVELFKTLSTGHKIVLNIAVQLISHLKPRTLVLLDEPESHLHPPLVAALLAAVSSAVRRFDSFGVVATHSPVVLQEIPSRHVRVIRRLGPITVADMLEVESFAENVGYLTRTVFSLDSSSTDFQRVLRELLESHTPDEINRLFPRGLSQQGRAVLATLEAIKSDDASN